MNGLMHGVYLAVVDSNELDQYGRIAITLEHVNADKRKYMARIATMLAGQDRGVVFLPDQNDHVAVVFEQGCIDKPIIIGSIWTKKAQMPETNDDKKNLVKLIRTRAGNEIRILDKQGGESIEIRSANGKITVQGTDIKLQGNVQVTGKLKVGTDTGAHTIIDKNEIKGSTS